MTRAITALTLALLVTTATVPALAQSLDDVVREIEAVYGRMTDLRADFTQTELAPAMAWSCALL